jgi:LAS superfamily LD-carboxypeptidase LdcB
MTVNAPLLTGKSEQHIHWLKDSCGIHHEVVKPWQNLVLAAKSQGFNLTIASGFRHFDRQRMIWNNKFAGKSAVKDQQNKVVDMSKLNDEQRIQAILTFSALPGASRHHWGTDIDVYDPNLLADNQQLQLEPWEYEGQGPFAPLSRWLVENALKFGFYFPYDQDRGGIATEPWHLSYFPLATALQKQLTPDLLLAQLTPETLLGKSTVFNQIKYIF